MRKYLMTILFIFGVILLSGCGTLIDKKPYKDNAVKIDRQDTNESMIKRMKRKGYDDIELETMGRIIEKDDKLFVETEYCYHPVPEEYTDLVTPEEEVRIIYIDAKVSSYSKDTVTFSFDDMLLYKVVTSEELLEQYDCKKVHTYYATYVFKGEGTVYDNRYAPAIGYYVESKDFSFLDNSMFSYDYFEQDYLSTYWGSSEEDDELMDKRRLNEITDSGIKDYIERFNDYGICY